MKSSSPSKLKKENKIKEIEWILALALDFFSFFIIWIEYH